MKPLRPFFSVALSFLVVMVLAGCSHLNGDPPRRASAVTPTRIPTLTPTHVPTLIPTIPPMAASPQVSVCPDQADVPGMARLLGAPLAADKLWVPLGENGWLLADGVYLGPAFVLTVPVGWTVDYNGGRVIGPGETPKRTAYSVYCELPSAPRSSASPIPAPSAVAGTACPAQGDVAAMVAIIQAPSATIALFKQLPPNGWVLTFGDYTGAAFRLHVPAGWVVDTPDGRVVGPGTTVPTTSATVYCEAG